ncbi:MAG: hypothetical protein DLM58_13340 [Pseudonocardiales bacterium]|nr:MAG: hypothetical protein DLM58_13340 [Pseudonocardiales bacterium]
MAPQQVRARSPVTACTFAGSAHRTRTDSVNCADESMPTTLATAGREQAQQRAVTAADVQCARARAPIRTA